MHAGSSNGDNFLKRIYVVGHIFDPNLITFYWFVNNVKEDSLYRPQLFGGAYSHGSPMHTDSSNIYLPTTTTADATATLLVMVMQSEYESMYMLIIWTRCYRGNCRHSLVWINETVCYPDERRASPMECFVKRKLLLFDEKMLVQELHVQNESKLACTS